MSEETTAVVETPLARAITSRRAIKSLGGNRIGEYTVLFGSPRLHDGSEWRDYFDKDTDFMLSAYERRPMFFHHALESSAKVHPSLATDPLIGYWDKTEVDQFGIYQEGELNDCHPAYSAVKGHVDRGELFPSSDSADHLVRRFPADREPTGQPHHVTRWPLLACSLTPVPAEGRMAPVAVIESAFKSLGVDFVLPETLGPLLVEPYIESGAQSGAAKSQYFGDFAEMDMTMAAVDSLKNRLCYGVLWSVLADETTTADEKKAALAAAFDEFKTLSLKVVSALLDGSGDETPQGAMKSLQNLKTFYLTVVPRDGLPQSEHNRTARETLRGYAQRMAEFSAIKTNGLPVERAEEVRAMLADLESIGTALKALLPKDPEAPLQIPPVPDDLPSLAALQMAQMRRQHELRQLGVATS